MALPREWTVPLPPWAHRAAYAPLAPLATLTERMSFVVAMADTNVRERTGGPFAAAIFDDTTGQLVSLGVNRVVPTSCSTAHAEVVAISLAQAALGTYDLGQGTAHPLQLVTSAAPCAMCLGAIEWSGIRRIIVGARESDIRAVGFDEGRKPAYWSEALRRRGFTVVHDVLRDEAASVLNNYRMAGGAIYHPAARRQMIDRPLGGTRGTSGSLGQTGLLVALEGIDGAGKDTQARVLAEWASSRGWPVKAFSFPDYQSSLGQVILQRLGDPAEEPHALQMLFSAARLESQRPIAQAREGGALVIVTRYRSSSVVYPVARGLDPAWCESLEAMLPDPDLTLLLDLDVELAMRRSGQRDELERHREMQSRCRSLYLQIARSDDSWRVVDASPAPADVAACVRECILPRAVRREAPA